jgi:hypothetical protein
MAVDSLMLEPFVGAAIAAVLLCAVFLLHCGCLGMTPQHPVTRTLRHFAVADFAACVLVMANQAADATGDGCRVLAVLLHYAILAVFAWFLMMALAMLWRLNARRNRALKPTSVALFMSLAWALPAVPVVISMLSSWNRTYSDSGFCWIASSTTRDYALVLLVALLAAATLAVLLGDHFVLESMAPPAGVARMVGPKKRKKKERKKERRKKENNEKKKEERKKKERKKI